MVFFADKKIQFKNKSNKSLNDDGVYVDGSFVMSDFFNCDVQPVSKKKIDSDIGDVVDADYKIFVDVIDIKDTTSIMYEEKEYKIVDSVKWDDYMILYISKVE